jgi:RNA polymerase sigma-70 factor (ECF subfamily)
MLEQPPFREQLGPGHEELLRLARALTRLTEDQRAVMELKLLRGLTVAEICELTSLSKRSLAAHLFQGMKALRALLDEPGNLSPGNRG